MTSSSQNIFAWHNSLFLFSSNWRIWPPLSFIIRAARNGILVGYQGPVFTLLAICDWINYETRKGIWFNVMKFIPALFRKILFYDRGWCFTKILKFVAGCMTKCLNLGGSSQWEAVQTVVDTTTTPTQLFGVVTGLFQSTSMFQVVLQPPKPYSMDFFSCRRRSTGAKISFTGGLNEDL